MKKRSKRAADAAEEIEDQDALAVLVEIRALLQAQVELLSIVACATARQAQIAHAEHRLAYPTGGAAASRDTLGLIKRVDQALTRFTMAEGLATSPAPAEGKSDG